MDNDVRSVWVMLAQSSGQWSDLVLIRGNFRLAKSDQRKFRAHFDHTLFFECTLVWSLVWDVLIRGYNGLIRIQRSDQTSLPDGTSTWAPLGYNSRGENMSWIQTFIKGCRMHYKTLRKCKRFYPVTKSSNHM